MTMDPGQQRARATLNRVLQVLGGGVLLLVVVVVAKTYVLGSSRQIDVPAAKQVAVDGAAVAAHLAGAIRARTVSSDNPHANLQHFGALHEHLRKTYPRVHAKLGREVIGEASLLYTWRGGDPKAGAVVLMAHQDVVPVAAGTAGRWKHKPFSGDVAGGFVWGRGAWDDKGNLIAQLEAVEALLAAGFSPKRTVYLAYGADEEVGGRRGAKRIAALLAKRQVKVDFVLDEGQVITEGVIKGLEKPAAIIGIAEKGYMSLRLSASGKPRHSSVPAPQSGVSPIARISRALARLDRKRMPARIGPILRRTFDVLAPEMSGFNRVAVSNLWVFSPMVRMLLSRKPATNATLRTTTALTVFDAGTKDNVVPGLARATVNFRILPGDSQAKVLDHVRRVIADPEVKITKLPFSAEPSKVAPTSSRGYKLVERAVRALFPGTIVAPGLMPAATDSRHYQRLTANVYRFSPTRVRPDDLARFHGTDERISVKNLVELVRFYRYILREGAGK